MPTAFDSDPLDEPALQAGADIRAALLRNLVDLYLQRPAHTAEEAQHFTELAIRLLDRVEVDARLAAARRLAAYPSTPAPVMQWLADDVPEVAVLARPAARDATSVLVEPRSGQVSAAELSDLFFTAGATERRLILVNLAYVQPHAAIPFASHNRDVAQQLEAAALAHKPDAFARALERLLGLGRTLARRIVHDPLGEPIVVIAKVIGIESDALQRILLFLNPVVGRSVYRVYELAMLFESVDATAAGTLVDIWRAAEPRVTAWPTPAEAAGGRRSAQPAAPPQRVPISAQVARVAGGKR